jgi:hypothetical protein
MRLNNVFFGLLLTAILVAPTLHAKVMPIALSELVKESDAIVIGRVIKLTNFDDVRIAELDVIQTIKGDSQLTCLHYWASPTWACDTSTANENETVLLLLSRAEKRLLSDASDFVKRHPASAKSLRNHLQNSPLFSITGSGGGRMVITENIVERNGYIIYPDEIKVIARRPIQYGHTTFSLLEDVFRVMMEVR